jgi:hypothetical protein
MVELATGARGPTGRSVRVDGCAASAKSAAACASVRCRPAATCRVALVRERADLLALAATRSAPSRSRTARRSAGIAMASPARTSARRCSRSTRACLVRRAARELSIDFWTGYRKTARRTN